MWRTQRVRHAAHAGRGSGWRTISGCSMCTKWPTSSRRHEARAEREVAGDVLGLRAPAHLLVLEAEHTEERHRQPGQAHERPLGPPRAEAAEAHRRVDLPAPAVGVVAGADRDEVAQPVASTGGGSCAPGARRARRSCPGRRWASALRRRWSSQSSRSFASRRVRSWFGDVGRQALRRQPVEVDEVADAVGHARRRAASSGRRPSSARRPAPARGGRCRARRARRGRRRPTSRARRGRCRRGHAGPTPRPANPRRRAGAQEGRTSPRSPCRRGRT